MKPFTAALAAVLAASLIAMCVGPTLAPARADDATTDLSLEALQGDIAVLASLNQLDLTKQQATALLDVSIELHTAGEKFSAERDAIRAQLQPMLAQKRALMLQDAVVPEALEKQVAGYQGQLDALDRKIVERLLPFADRFRALMSAAQLQIITGDYEARRQAEEWLDSVRDIPKESFKDELRPIVKEFADPTANLDEKSLTNLFTEAHTLDLKAYAKKKPEYVTRLSPLFRPQKGNDEQLIVQFFMHPRMVPVLKDKLAVMK